jgi:hypothetical protein
LIYILFVLRLFVRLEITAAKFEPAPLIELQGSQERQTRDDCNMAGGRLVHISEVNAYLLRVAGGRLFQITEVNAHLLRVPHSSVFEGCGF